MLFSLYIVDIVDNISCNSLQYADDTTLYQHCKLKNLQNCIEKLESNLQTVSDWALQNSLVFNDDKTKYLLFSSIQLSKRHNLSQPDKCKLIHNNEPVERLNSTKILGVHFDENLTWITHVNNLIKSSHVTLRRLKRFKRFTNYKIRKTQAETLILSNLRYCIPVYSQLPKYLIRHLQRTQSTVAGYVLGRYAKESDFITTLGWLPVQEMMEFAIVKCTFSALNDPNWPKYLPIKLQEMKRTTSLESEMMVERGEKNIFGDQAHDIFNDLPKTIRVIKDRKFLLRKLKDIIEVKLLQDPYLFSIKLTMVIVRYIYLFFNSLIFYQR